jgi:NADPH-dependent 2,4-dienoyl-CoA reductase/sulfur reductase-like enzyme/nitrite reductase/ring-hydroxylating ferredoxin subunit
VATDPGSLTGPDLGRGVPLSDIPDGGTLAGHALGKPVLLVRRGTELFAVDASCTHYGGPLAEGLVVGDTVRCPWHHACFSLRTGEAVRAPALRPLDRWNVEVRDGRVHVSGVVTTATARRTPARSPASVVIVGGGAAGDAAADVLRREGYEGPITLVSADTSAPYDRPNLSKDYLAGNAPEEWIPLRTPEFYRDLNVTLRLETPASGIDRASRRVQLSDGSSLGYDALLIATGASPIRLSALGPAVQYLRTLDDSRSIIAAAKRARRAVVIGASFIGLEVAASLRARGVEVHVVAPEQVPLERILGVDIGGFVRGVHEAHGVSFHLGRSVRAVDATGATLDDGSRVAADLVVAGIGVRPNEELAAAAGLAVDKGIVVNQYLETNTPGIFAAGDVARFPDPRSGTNIRVEHWVVAQRMGQTAARNILGANDPFDAVPFFWSAHFDSTICYVGHAAAWDDMELSGSLEKRDCTVTYRAKGRTLAIATIGRDRASLEAELALERMTSTISRGQ